MDRIRSAAFALLLVAGALGAASVFGTPHLRIKYNTWECWYFGLNGWELDGIGASCPLIKVFPWR